MSTHTRDTWVRVATADGEWTIEGNLTGRPIARMPANTPEDHANAELVTQAPKMFDGIETQRRVLEVYALQVSAMVADITECRRRLDEACEQRDALLSACEAVLLFHSGAWAPEDRQRWEALTGGADATTRGLCDFLRAEVAEAKP